VWLVHKGGFTSARLQPGAGASEGDSNVSIKLDSGEVLMVDEEDVEKVRGAGFDSSSVQCV
jgi:hypothetical protein